MLSGVGLANMSMAFLVYMLMMGLNSALDTLISNAAGAGNVQLCGVYLNRGRFILCCVFTPLILAMVNVESILLFFKQDKDVAKYAGHYVLVYMPGLFL